MFKRNQLEEAILRSSERDLAIGQDDLTPGGEDLRVRMKRLLDSDRKREVSEGSLFDRNYAFFSAAAPGTGQEVWFSGYEVFALWVGLKLLASGYPQGRVVTVLRHRREALEREHARILAVDLRRLFKKFEFLTEDATDAQREHQISAGQLVTSIADMVFLAVEAVPGIGISTRTIGTGDAQRPSNICRGGKELLHFMQVEGFMKRPVLAVELTNGAHQLAWWLARTEPVRRGRR